MPGPRRGGRVGLWAGDSSGRRARTLRDLERGKTEAQRGKGPAGTPQRITPRPGLEPGLQKAGVGGTHRV